MKKLLFTIVFISTLAIGQEKKNSKDFGLKNNPKTVYDVVCSKYPSNKSITLHQDFDKKGRLKKHTFAFNGFSINTYSFIYKSNMLNKIVETVKNYTFKREYVYDYINNNEVIITSYNNSKQAGGGGAMTKVGVSINFYNNSILTKSQKFSNKLQYDNEKPSREITYKYDKKHHLIEKKEVSYRYNEKYDNNTNQFKIEEVSDTYENKVIFKYNTDSFLVEEHYYSDDKIRDILYYKYDVFDDKGNWLKCRVESKNDASKNYTISRKINYYE